MRQRKNVVLVLCMLCVFALTGCMKLVLNNGLISSEPSESQEDTYDYIQYVETSEGVPDDTTTQAVDVSSSVSSRIRYEQLSDVQKAAYEELYEGILNHEESINVSEAIDETDLDRVYDAIINTADFELIYPTRRYEFKYDVLTGNVYKVNPTYEVSLEERDYMQSQVDAVVEDVVAQTTDLDVFQTVKFFHDYVILNCSYDDSLTNYSNAYGALVEGKAVCEGYARAFKYLCDRVGIPCELVIGSTNVDHMWNVVQIDGDWYHIDLTWDDPKNKDGDYISYTYFNLTQNDILKDHTIDDSYTVPLANSTAMNYFNYYGLSVASVDEFGDKLYGQIYDAVLHNRQYVYFRAESQEVYEGMLYSLGNDYVLYSDMEEASESAGATLDTSSVSYSYDDVMLTLTIALNY